jgi:predicted Zn-dependent peptidase
VSDEPVRLETLDNGLRVVTQHMPGLRSAAVGVWVDVGARHEEAALNGVSHFLEHMAFKGTTSRSAREIVEAIEDKGGQLNAYTSREHTAYHARILAEDVPLALELIADILRHSVLDPAEIEREREVILQEIGQVEDTPDDIVFDLWQAGAFPDQPIGRPVLGSAETVRAVSRDRLTGHLERHYVPGAMVLAATGAVEHARIVELALRLFGDLAVQPPVPAEPARYQAADIRLRRRLEQAHVVLGLEGLGYHDPDLWALQVLSTVLGGGMSSRLFQEIREKRGLAYSVFTFTNSFTDCGTFGVYAGTSGASAAELLRVVAAETVAMTEVTDEVEIERAKSQLRAGLVMGLESCAALCEELARQILIHGRPIPPEETLARIDAVDAPAVRRVARRLLERPQPALTVLGPQRRLEPLDRIARRLRA